MENPYDKALEAIMDLFNDKSYSLSEARANLRTLVDEIRILLDSIEEEEE